MIGKPWHCKRCYGVIAITRSGLPEPLTILSGAAITIAPVGGSNSRFTRLVMPNLPAPCMYVWLGNGGSEAPALPAWGPTVSTPTPKIKPPLARKTEQFGWKNHEADPSPSGVQNPPPPFYLLQP